MPTISVFFGITITMYNRDHNPPHFHARYGDAVAVFAISNLELKEGSLGKRGNALVHEWAAQHQQELLDNWNRLQNEQPAQRIEPLQ